MADVTHAEIDDLEPIQGFLEGFTFRRAGVELGVTPFGMSIIDMPPDTTGYPEHDHSSEGPGNPPAHQLGQGFDVLGRFLQQQQIGTVAADQPRDILDTGAPPPQQIPADDPRIGGFGGFG